MYAMAMSSAWTEDKQRGGLAHRYVYPNGHIGRQPVNEENRRFFECALLKARAFEFIKMGDSVKSRPFCSCTV